MIHFQILIPFIYPIYLHVKCQTPEAIFCKTVLLSSLQSYILNMFQGMCRNDIYFIMIEDHRMVFVCHFTGSGGTKHNSSNTGIIVGPAVGGFVLVVLLVLAGMYAFRQKGRAERANQQSHPFGKYSHHRFNTKCYVFL